MFARKDSFSKLLWFLLFFLMIFMPRQLQMIKIGLMLVIFTYKTIKHGFSIRLKQSNKYVNRFMICWFASAALSIAVGIIHSNPGIKETFRMDIVYVGILLFLFFTIDSREELEWINRTILVSGFICAVYMIIWFLVNIGIWPRSLFYAFDYTTNFGQHEGYTHMTNTNGSMLIPILPMFFVSVMTSSKEEGRLWKWIELFFCVMAAVLSGRRMIWAAIPYAVFFVLILAIIHPEKVRYSRAGTNRKRLYVILLGVIALGVFLIANGIINIDSVISRFQAVMAGGEEAGERSGQAKALIEGFLRHPLLGNGAGATAEGSLRNQEFTWAYELSYHAVLFHSGMVGFALYIFALLNIASGCIAGARRRRSNSYSSFVSLLAALVMGFIANATNPYFSSSFDFLWWILWPLGYVYADEKMYRKECEFLLII